jgi:DNA-nicking Smr family endonuclease
MTRRPKRDDPDAFHRPFEGLRDLLPRRRREPPAPPRPAPAPPPTAAGESELFAQAMSGVQPIDWNRPAGSSPPPRSQDTEGQLEDSAELARLRQLVEHGEGFVVSDTPEYMEGLGYLAPPEITTRLHRGDFSVQGHVDLHGLTVDAAREVFDGFLRESLQAGKRTVLVIHGRGLSSPADPVLKTKVAEWLCSNRWRKWVVAFTSARMCDGGSGASYVLLRRRPVSKRLRHARPAKRD